MAVTTERKIDRRRRGTRDAILARAVELARAEGLEGLTIGRLAAEMKMSKSGVFRHFGSKEELQLAAIETAARSYVDEVVAPALERAEGADRLRALAARHFDDLERRSEVGGCFWASSGAEFDDRPGPVRDRVREFLSAWLDLLAREAAHAGAADPRQVAFEFHSLTLAANMHAQLFDDRDGFKRARAAMERLLPA